MKKIKITIVGTPIIVEYSSKQYTNEDGEFDFYGGEYFMTLGWDSVDGLYVDVPEDTYDFDNYENLIKKKGKYVKTVEYFHNLFAEDSGCPLPVEIHTRHSNDGESLDYYIELNDDEEFDIKKVQLIKSDYEIDIFPYFILAEKILYDGKEIGVYDVHGEYSDYGIDGRSCSEFEIDEYVNG